MLFTSPVFLFLFIPILLVLYFCAPRISLKNSLLLLASLFFYAWGETYLVLILIISIIMNYVFGLLIAKWRDKKFGYTVLVSAIIANLSILAYFKYAEFFIDNLNVILPIIKIDLIEQDSIHLPLGISFFTFQAMSYVIDIYRRKFSAQRNFTKVALYISLFPQLIAGPIVRYPAIAKTLSNRLTNAEQFTSGIKRFIFGLSKKILIANTLGAITDQVFSLPANELSFGLTWLGIICFTLQIYFDFAGYSDMAIGLGKMFGFNIPENFNYPYVAKSINEFWRRWHISLSTWFRDYLYISLGGNRVAKWHNYANILIVFFLCGLWHGASWSFVIWGLLHGTLMILERAGLGKLLQKLGAPASHFYLIFAVTTTWVFFRADNIGYATRYLGAMFGFGNGTDAMYYPSLYITTEGAIALFIGILFSTPIYPLLARYLSEKRSKDSLLYVGAYSTNIVILISLCFLSLLNIAAGTYNPFIYFRF